MNLMAVGLILIDPPVPHVRSLPGAVSFAYCFDSSVARKVSGHISG